MTPRFQLPDDSESPDAEREQEVEAEKADQWQDQKIDREE